MTKTLISENPTKPLVDPKNPEPTSYRSPFKFYEGKR
jgi:hypothetical protein